MHELDDYTLLQRTGVLWFGDSTITTSEGNILAAKKNLERLKQPFQEVRGKEQISRKFPFIAGAVSDVKDPIALFLHDGGTINVPALVDSFVKALRSCPNCNLLEEARVTSIDYSDSEVQVYTDKGQKYRGKKVVLTPGTYVNQVLTTLKPAFQHTINYIIYLWSSTYFKVKEPLEARSDLWPIWYFFGQPNQPSTSDDEPCDSNSYYGFPTDSRDQPGYARVAPAFTSQATFDYTFCPPSIDARPVDHSALQFTSNFVQKSMPSLEYTLKPEEESTCIAGFAELIDEKDDPGAGFVVDFVPNTKNRIVLATGGWCMKFIPMMGVILADLAIDGKTSYSQEIKPMNIMRGILTPKEHPPTKKQRHLVASSRAAKFNKIWS